MSRHQETNAISSQVPRPQQLGSNNSVPVKCPICMETCPITEVQQFSLCGHTFCNQCLSFCQNNAFCPQFGCQSTRATEVLVDEVDESEREPNDIAEKLNKITMFGHTRQPALLKLEERQRCDARKGYFQCVNVARMTLVECRHRLCFDCMAKKITDADAVKELPRCPVPRCANPMTKSEVSRVAEKVHSANLACSRVLATAQLSEATDEERATPKDEVRVYCSVYNSDTAVTKSMNVPKICTVSDMTTALMQMHHLNQHRTAGSIGLFIRTINDSGKVRYDPLNLKKIGKKPIRDANINENAHLVLDLNRLLPPE